MANKTELQDFKKIISKYKNADPGKRDKYQRNLQRYLYSYGVTLDQISQNGNIGINTIKPIDSVEINVIRSIIDTLVNRIASLKAIPFFTTINGNFRDRQIIKNAQRFFDVYYEDQHLQTLVPEVFRDACIFDTGFVFLDNETKTIKRQLPWQVYLNPAEISYGVMNSVLVIEEQVPFKPNEDKKNRRPYKTVIKYWNIETKEHIEYIPETEFYKVEEFNYNKLPIIPLYFSKPIIGSRNTSIVDQLRSIQYEIDVTFEKIREAFKRNQAQTFWVPEDPEGPTLNVQELDNGVGNVVQYRPVLGNTGIPVLQTTPNAIDPQYFEYIQHLKESAYNQIGISELSAIGRKDAGLDSGVAIKTVQQIEGDRFQINQDLVLELYKEITKCVIELFEGSVLPKDKERVDVSWNDIRKEVDNMKVQFSCADAMSKDPQTKAQQIEMLKQLGVPKNELISLTEIPDIDRGFTIMTNAFDAVNAVINDCIDNDNFDVPSFIPFVMLMDEIQSTQLNLTACGYQKNKPTIDKLQKLYDIVSEMNKQVEAANAIDQTTATAITEMSNENAADTSNAEQPDMNLQTDGTVWNQ